MTSTALARLEPPYTRSAAATWLPRPTPLTTGPRLVRGDHPQRPGRYWHRVRSGTRQPAATHRPVARATWHLWCGPMVFEPHYLTANTVPDGEPLCGTCEGRAIGAGHPPVLPGISAGVLRFEPVTQRPAPPVCPISARGMRWSPAMDRLTWPRFTCPVCGEVTGWYGRRPRRHEPGPGLVEPCPFHRWDQLVLDSDGRVRCACTPQDGAA